MTVKRGLASGAAILAAVMLLASGSVARASSLDISGKWNAVSNNTRHVQLTIVQQSATTPCAPITGTMNTPSQASTISGFYCPADRTVTFTRTLTGTSIVEYYTGHASTGGADMSGSFTTIPSSPPPSGSQYPYLPWLGIRLTLQ
jgi:hypothetical protein